MRLDYYTPRHARRPRSERERPSTRNRSRKVGTPSVGGLYPSSDNENESEPDEPESSEYDEGGVWVDDTL